MVALRTIVNSVNDATLNDVLLTPVLLTDELSGDACEKAQVLAELILSTASHLKWLFDTQAIIESSATIEDDASVHVSQSISSPYEQQLELLISLLVPKLPVLQSILRACADATNRKRNTPTCKSFGVCFVLGGEATVRVKQLDGSIPTKGGRCSHLALQCAVRWYELMNGREGYGGMHCGLLAGASDGLDGPGAYGGGVWVSTSPVSTIATEDAYHEAVQSLQTYNSYEFFQIHGPNCIIPARLTNTNVMDIFIATAVIYADQHTARASL